MSDVEVDNWDEMHIKVTSLRGIVGAQDEEIKELKRQLLEANKENIEFRKAIMDLRGELHKADKEIKELLCERKEVRRLLKNHIEDYTSGDNVQEALTILEAI